MKEDIFTSNNLKDNQKLAKRIWIYLLHSYDFSNKIKSYILLILVISFLAISGTGLYYGYVFCVNYGNMACIIGVLFYTFGATLIILVFLFLIPAFLVTLLNERKKAEIRR